MNKSKCFAALFMAAVFGLSACAKDPTFRQSVLDHHPHKGRIIHYACL